MHHVLKLSVSAFCLLGAITTGCSSGNSDNDASTQPGSVGTNTGGTSSRAAASDVGGNTGNRTTSVNAGGKSTGSSAAASGGSSATSSGMAQRFAYVWLLNNQTQTEGAISQLQALFYTMPSDACVRRDFGDCQVTTNCPDTDTLPVRLSAGTITVSSPAMTKSVTLAPNADNTYDQVGLGAAFRGGETAHVVASGGTIPAFSGDVTAPLVLLMDSPAPDATGLISADRSSDLVFQFSRGAAGVQLAAKSADGSLVCRSAPGAGSLTIPKTAMDAATSNGALGMLSLYTLFSTDIAAGDYTVNLGVTMSVYSSDKQHRVLVYVD